MSKIKIALDAMGGDVGPAVVVPAALSFVASDPNVELILVGRDLDVRKYLNKRLPEGISIYEASEIVRMDELPSLALRKKKDSSMRVAIDLVKAGKADACVCAGNTGALMAMAHFVLKMLPYVDRPAIITALPNMESKTWVLDLGANVHCTEKNLFQFAVMGSEQVSSLADIRSPRVGLLNVGQEEIKGNEQVRKAHKLLLASNLNYIGYVEGGDIYKGCVDVVVADGFVGNIALKNSEGLARMISQLINDGFRRNPLTMIAGLIALPILRSIYKQIDPRYYNGASFLGIDGIVIKSHGSADEIAFRNAIGIAKKAVYTNIPSRIGAQVKKHLEAGE